VFPTQWGDWETFWRITAFLSIILAFMNLLPIPALDGGHVLFTLVEMITGRKPSDKFLEYAQIVGMVFLLSLMLYANGNDWFGWGKGR
jgi:regulator of sigma E protease